MAMIRGYKNKVSKGEFSYDKGQAYGYGRTELKEGKDFLWTQL